MSADEMFEKLGYQKHETKYNIVYSAVPEIFKCDYISFSKEHKSVEQTGISKKFVETIAEILSAIMKKCEELRVDRR